ncbi:hypothetical protein YC2023_084297 [Brassica napus]
MELKKLEKSVVTNPDYPSLQFQHVWGVRPKLQEDRSYSMSALPASNTAPVTGPIKTQSSKPSFDHEDWDNYSGQNITKWLEVRDIRALIFLRCPIGAG